MPMRISLDRLRLHVLDELCYQSLRVIPLQGVSSDSPPYRLLDADTAPHVKISEVGDSGIVQRIAVHNDLEDRLLLLDGQELLGARQNRILNTDVLVPAGSKLQIPVSCVEQGRWHWSSEQFRRGKHLPSSGRRGKAERVRASLAAGAGHDGGQGAVWGDVAHVLSCHQVASPSGELNAAYRKRETDLKAVRQAIRLPAGTLGAAVFFQNSFMGMDVFDRAGTLEHFWDSLLDSYALDWIASPVLQEPGPEVETSEVLKELEGAPWERHASPGEGSDCRARTARLTASCLLWEEAYPLHVQAFPVRGEGDRGSGQPNPTRLHRRYGPR
jgi:hypothetical protein